MAHASHDQERPSQNSRYLTLPCRSGRLSHRIAPLSAALLVAVGLSGRANAQGTGLIPVRVKIGALLPSDHNSRDAGGSVLPMAEIDVAVPQPGLGTTYFTAGYSEGSKSGRRLRVIPLTISQVFSPPNPASGITGNVYLGAGVGAYLLRLSGNGDSSNKTVLGGFGVAGYQFPNSAFIEAKYHLTGKTNGVSASGLALLIGRRF